MQRLSVSQTRQAAQPHWPGWPCRPLRKTTSRSSGACTQLAKQPGHDIRVGQRLCKRVSRTDRRRIRAYLLHCRRRAGAARTEHGRGEQWDCRIQ